MKLNWVTDATAGYPVDVAHIGPFEVTITEGGAGTIGATVYVGTFSGRPVAICGSREQAENRITMAAVRALLLAGRELGEIEDQKTTRAGENSGANAQVRGCRNQGGDPT